MLPRAGGGFHSAWSMHIPGLGPEGARARRVSNE